MIAAQEVLYSTVQHCAVQVKTLKQGYSDLSTVASLFHSHTINNPV